MKEEATCSAPGSHQKQAWKRWDSMKKIALILGPALLILVAFRYSVAWHLQKFWGASGIFWQTQWENLHHMVGGNEWVIFFLGIAVLPGLCFFCFNGILMVADVTGKPSFITRYRIQLGKNEPVDRAKLHNAIRTISFNLFIDLLLLVLLKLRGVPCSLKLPTFHWILVELAIIALLSEIFNYYGHRLAHHPLLYKHMHKKHHEWTAPISIIFLYAHPVDHVLFNMLPLITGPILLRSHIVSITAWFSCSLLHASLVHCGYHLPFLPSPEFHDFHHLNFNQCYGVLGIMDRLHGTDAIFRQTKAYERHFVLLGLTPLTESIPDSPKKSE